MGGRLDRPTGRVDTIQTRCSSSCAGPARTESAGCKEDFDASRVSVKQPVDRKNPSNGCHEPPDATNCGNSSQGRVIGDGPGLSRSPTVDRFEQERVVKA
jgi:hypothetical protein